MKSQKVIRTDQVPSAPTLLQSYLSYNDLYVKSGDANDMAVFTPFLLMDAMYMIYTEHVKPLHLKHNFKLYSNRMVENYAHFNKSFFAAFTDEQQVEICDKMDSFYEFIHNDLEIFKVAVMDRFMKYDADLRITLANMLACNILAQSAQYLHTHIFKKENEYLKSVEKWSQELFCEYGRGKVHKCDNVDLSDYKPLATATNVLCKRISEFKFN